MMKTILIVSLLAISVGGVCGQGRGGDFVRRHVTWNADFGVRFDNREYDSEFSSSKTYFSYKAGAFAGVRWGEGNRHSIMAGGAAVRHMGSRWGEQPEPEMALYYHFRNNGFEVRTGAVPRAAMTAFPREFVSGTNSFYDLMVEGVIASYQGRRVTTEFALDWHGMLGETQRERFMLYSLTKWNITGMTLGYNGSASLTGGYYAMMHHFAGSRTEPGVVDYMQVKPYLELSVRGNRGLQGLVGVSWLQSFQRDRAIENKMLRPGGFMGTVEGRWRSLGVNNTVFAGVNDNSNTGDSMMPFYGRYGGELYLSDPYFRTTHNMYNRLEVFWSPKIGNGVSLKLSSVHHYDGDAWGWQQQVTFSAKLNKGTFGR